MHFSGRLGPTPVCTYSACAASLLSEVNVVLCEKPLRKGAPCAMSAVFLFFTSIQTSAPSSLHSVKFPTLIVPARLDMCRHVVLRYRCMHTRYSHFAHCDNEWLCQRISTTLRDSEQLCGRITCLLSMARGCWRCCTCGQQDNRQIDCDYCNHGICEACVKRECESCPTCHFFGAHYDHAELLRGFKAGLQLGKIGHASATAISGSAIKDYIHSEIQAGSWAHMYVCTRAESNTMDGQTFRIQQVGTSCL